MIDETQIAIGRARRITSACEQIMVGLRVLRDVEEERANSGMDFSDPDIEAAIQAQPSTSHLDGATLTLALASGTAVLAFLVSNFHDDNFDRTRGPS